MIHKTGTPDDQDWDQFVAAHPSGHVLQTSRWSQLKQAYGWDSARVVVRFGDDPDGPIRAGCALLFRRLPWGQTLAYAPKGPLVDWADEQAVTDLLSAMRRACAAKHAALLKIEPELPTAQSAAEQLRALGFRESPQRVQPVSTIHIDLVLGEEEILAGMKSKWRYNIRLAERKGVSIRDGNADDLPAVQALLAATSQRDRFGVHDIAYYALATDLFLADGSLVWLLAEHDGELLAAIAVFALGEMAWYMWGASGDHCRHLMPNHALQWAAILWARSRGCRSYDLWGIPDEVGLDPDAYGDPDSWGSEGLWGVYRFKQGFGGRVVRYVGAWDLPLSFPGYALYRLGWRLRRVLSQRTPAGPAAG